VFVTREAGATRAEQIAEQFLASMTLGSGQFCTKPGVLVVPEQSAISDTLRRLTLPPPAILLNDRIQHGYTDVLEELMTHPEVRVLARGDAPLSDPPSPTILATSIDAVLEKRDELFRECFGPTALVVSYQHDAQLLDLARAIDGQLTATVFGALIPMRTWFPFTPSTVTVTSSPMTTDSPTLRVKISILRALRRASFLWLPGPPRLRQDSDAEP